jgi:hypothetical protein
MTKYSAETESLREELTRQRSDFRRLLDEYLATVNTDATQKTSSPSPAPSLSQESQSKLFTI